MLVTRIQRISQGCDFGRPGGSKATQLPESLKPLLDTLVPAHLLGTGRESSVAKGQLVTSAKEKWDKETLSKLEPLVFMEMPSLSAISQHGLEGRAWSATVKCDGKETLHCLSEPIYLS